VASPPKRASKRRNSNIDGGDSIVDAAAGVFRERGYDATSIEMVAAAAGLSKSSLYHHVSSKEELLKRILERAMAALMSILDEPGAQNGTSLERLTHVVGRAVDVQVDELTDVGVMLSVRGNTDVERWALDQRRLFDQAMSALIKHAQRDGYIRNDFDAATVSRLVLGMVAWTAEWYTPEGRISSMHLRDHVVSMVFDGIRKDGISNRKPLRKTFVKAKVPKK
jgi:AcrR family transcriptional regulator